MILREMGAAFLSFLLQFFLDVAAIMYCHGTGEGQLESSQSCNEVRDYLPVPIVIILILVLHSLLKEGLLAFRHSYGLDYILKCFYFP